MSFTCQLVQAGIEARAHVRHAQRGGQSDPEGESTGLLRRNGRHDNRFLRCFPNISTIARLSTSLAARFPSPRTTWRTVSVTKSALLARAHSCLVLLVLTHSSSCSCSLMPPLAVLEMTEHRVSASSDCVKGAKNSRSRANAESNSCHSSKCCSKTFRLFNIAFVMRTWRHRCLCHENMAAPMSD